MGRELLYVEVFNPEEEERGKEEEELGNGSCKLNSLDPVVCHQIPNRDGSLFSFVPSPMTLRQLCFILQIPG